MVHTSPHVFVGLNDCPSSMPVFGSQWGTVVQDAATRAERGIAVRQDAYGRPYLKDRGREPYFCNFYAHTEAGSNSAAVDVWTWRDEGNMLMVKRVISLAAYFGRGREKASGALPAAVADALVGAIQDIRRYCEGYG